MQRGSTESWYRNWRAGKDTVCKICKCEFTLLLPSSTNNAPKNGPSTTPLKYKAIYLPSSSSTTAPAAAFKS